MNILPDFVIRRARDRKHWPLVVRISALLNRIGVYFLSQSRLGLAAIYPDGRFTAQDDFVVGLGALQSKVSGVLARYQSDEKTYKYFYGQPYQGLGIAGIFGDRGTDYRFDDYELRDLVGKDDHLLDIGCNCGFIAVLTTYRTGCRSTGIDINPYMVEIGTLVAQHLRIADLVDLKAGKLQDFAPGPVHDVVLSFATHWTDDQNYRVSVDDHMNRMSSYLKPGGRLIFESHCNDVGNAEFYAALEAVRDRFKFDGIYKKTDAGTRELYVMTKI